MGKKSQKLSYKTVAGNKLAEYHIDSTLKIVLILIKVVPNDSRSKKNKVSIRLNLIY